MYPFIYLSLWSEGAHSIHVFRREKFQWHGKALVGTQADLHVRREKFISNFILVLLADLDASGIN